jgi:hypothetical protein
MLINDQWVKPIPEAAFYDVGLRPFAWWGYEFQSFRGNGCLSLVSVVCCQVEIQIIYDGRGLCVGLITRPEESNRMCGMSECDREAWTMSPLAHWGLSCHHGMDEWLNDRCSVHGVLGVFPFMFILFTLHI